MTSPEQYIDIAQAVFERCNGYDLWFPHPSQTAIVAWAHTFAESRLTREDLLAGVDHAYNKNPEGYRPTPASIVTHAHTAYFEALKDLPDDRRKLMEEANFALQDMGFAPNEAHRYSRAIALGRKANITLSEDQDRELRQRLAAAREVQALPPRQLESLWNVLPDRNTSRDPRRAFQKPDTDDQDTAA
ncbi:hypothetical protein ACFYY5_29005 [Nocardia elegans]|uniref:Uncharacterized protein n=1 Tax=Nocardia elegans TaxID=300029 RepID=A0ABW6TL90_9NOCA